MFYYLCFLLGDSPASEFYMPTFRNALFHLHRRIGILHTYPPMKMEQTECSETSAYKIQTPRNYPEENIQHSEHGESWKSRIYFIILFSYYQLFIFIFSAHFINPYPANVENMVSS